MAEPSRSQLEIERDLEPELKPIFREFVDDYKAAASAHVSGYKGGGPSFKVVAELVRNGWRKQTKNSN